MGLESLPSNQGASNQSPLNKSIWCFFDELGGQRWAMPRGSGGQSGTRGDVESVTYRKGKDF